MEESKSRQRLFGQRLFECAFMILAVKNILDVTSLIERPEWLDNLLLLGFFGLIFCKLALQTYQRIRFIGFIIILIIFTYACREANNYYLIFTFFGIIAIQDVVLEDVLKKTSIIKFVFIMVHIIVFFAMMLFSKEEVPFVYREGIKRYSFMLGHPNTFSMYVLWTSLEFIYSRYNKMGIFKLILIWLVNVFAFLFTDSNTSIIVATMAMILMILEKKGGKLYGLIISPISKYGFAFCTVFFPLIIVGYNQFPKVVMGLFNVLNEKLTGRLLYGAYAYDIEGFSLIGRTIKFPSKSLWKGQWLDTIFFDNAYIWMFIIYGYLYLILIAVLFIVIAKRTNMLEKILIISYTLFAIMEAYVINASICFTLLFIGKYLYEFNWKSEEKNIEKNIGQIERMGIGYEHHL
jgi:hypothetical protein